MKIKKFNCFENINSENQIIPVYVTNDGDGHWFIIPLELKHDFNNDLNNEYFVDSGNFDDKYGKYRTGGDLNSIQLYAKI